MSKQLFQYNKAFALESGNSLPSLEIAFHTYGSFNKAKNNVVWICHALTANSDAADWWHELVGKGKIFDTDKYFIVCANILGSCYGSSGPLSTNSITGKKYYSEFPKISIRDMVNAHVLLRKHLKIKNIYLGAGGSMGAYQLLEWSLIEPAVFKRLVLMNTSARESAWGIAIHTAQRLAIEADSTWKNKINNAGANGLKAARAIGMLTYRNYDTFVEQQTDKELDKLDDYKASSYIIYQGEKLLKRFCAQSYWILTKAMDSHNLTRKRNQNIKTSVFKEEALKNTLKKIKVKTLVIGISSDILCPVDEQKFLANYLPKATLKIITSSYGHDGFLIEGQKLTKTISDWIN